MKLLTSLRQIKAVIRLIESGRGATGYELGICRIARRLGYLRRLNQVNIWQPLGDHQ